MPKTEEPSTSMPSSSTASLSSTSTLPPPPPRPRLQQVLSWPVDWKDVVALVVGVTFLLALLSLIGPQYGRQLSIPGVVVGNVVSWGFFFLRRLLARGPRPIVRTGPLWRITRVLSGVVLLLGVGLLWKTALAFDAAEFVTGALALAVGSVVDHILRTPAEELS